MIALSRPFPRTSMDDGPLSAASFMRFPFGGAVIATVFGFLAFMPYPAIPVGASTGLQFGSLLTLLLVLPCLFLPWKGRPFFIAPVLLAALSLSLLKVAFTDSGSLGLCFKSMLVTGMAGFTLLATQRLAPQNSLHLLTGIAAATVVHAIVGFWQLYAFEQGQFPLLGLYVNPSFLSVQDNASIIVRYIQRPFGLFPEPSAMSSSLAPWVVLFIAEALGLVRLRHAPSRRQRALFVTAALGALGLIIISRSGHATIVLAAMSVLAVAWFLRSRATVGSYLMMVLVFCIALPLVFWMGAESLSDRIGSGSYLGDDSWRDRAKSLKAGLSLLVEGSPATWIFGIGPGLTSPAIKAATGFEAVWSVLLPYVYQTGLLGMMAVSWVGIFFVRVWRAARLNITFVVMLFVWFVGIAITTSYGQLLPLWIAMAWLTVWPEVCAPVAQEKSRAAELASRLQQNWPDPKSGDLPLTTPGAAIGQAETRGRVSSWYPPGRSEN